MNSASSYRQILRSSSIIGGASVINILVGLMRTKVAAVLLGPSGIGVIGLFQSLMATASSVSSLGWGNVGTRQIAEATGRGDIQATAAARRALFWGSLGLAVIGATAFWLLRGLIAEHVLHDASLTDAVGWLALGVGLTVASGSQSALLNGMRRIGDMARASLLSALLSTMLGVAAIFLWNEAGVIAFVLAAPLASFFMGHLFVSRLPSLSVPATPLPQIIGQWQTLVRLGVAFMFAGLVVTVGHLVVRTIVQRELGAEALGHFQAAWAISMTYIGFVLQAMGTDYYPRLTAVINDHSAANRMVNEQTEVALLLAGPILVAMLGLAPWIIELLYSSSFSDAVNVLRWQVLGDLLKVVSWPLGFIILASGDGRAFMLTESLSILAFVLLTWFALPRLGVEATGLAFLGMYVIYLPTVYLLARRRTGFVWAVDVFSYLAIQIFIAVVVCITAAYSKWLGGAVGVTAATALALYSFSRLGQMTNLAGPLGRAATLSSQLFFNLRNERD